MDRCHHRGHERCNEKLRPALDRAGGAIAICSDCQELIDDVIDAAEGDVTIYFEPAAE